MAFFFAHHQTARVCGMSPEPEFSLPVRPSYLSTASCVSSMAAAMGNLGAGSMVLRELATTNYPKP